MNRRALLTTAIFAGFAAPASAQGVLDAIAGTGTGATAFVQLATISDNFEIESSRIALARSQHPQIREFAQRMIEHHTMLSTELRSLPEATTRLPANLDDRRSNQLTILRQQENEDLFNRYYVQQQIEGHEEAVTAYETYARSGEVPALQAFAQKHAPMIRSHLDMARALQSPRAG
jgi:putative membrane protein